MTTLVFEGFYEPFSAPSESVAATDALPVPVDGVPAVRLEKVGKTWPARPGQPSFSALSDIDLEVRKGSILGVIGPSGAGKSTLVRLVNGLEKATSGRIRLFGEDVTDLSESGRRRVRRGIGMIFQHFNLLSSRTVFDNVALPLEIAGADRATVRSRVESLLDLVGLSDKAERYPAELSGGQKQRVGIARALATEPAILLCDEATSALDPETTKSILALLKRINRELGVTILVITHEIPVIKDLCDEVAVIQNGRIVESGSVFDVFTAPQHPTTARFVEDVTSVEIPSYLRDRVTAEAGPESSLLLRIRFVGEHATSPVVSRLTTTLGADVNIVAGKIEAIADRPFGTLLVAVPGSPPTRDAAVAALRTLGFRFDILGHVAAERVATECKPFGFPLIAENAHVA